MSEDERQVSPPPETPISRDLRAVWRSPGPPARQAEEAKAEMRSAAASAIQAAARHKQTMRKVLTMRVGGKEVKKRVVVTETRQY